METRPEEYVLGTDRVEVERLRDQHEAWAESQHALLGAAGIPTGAIVLELGSGPGWTTFELARRVGPEGRVVARDANAGFLAFLADEARRRGLGQVETSEGAVEALELPAASFDAVYARWLFSWLVDPGAVLARAAHGLAPGGAIVLQEYLDWGALKRIPPSPVFARAVERCLASFDAAGGLIDVGERLPALGAACGLELEHFEPIARAGAPGSLVWRWIEGFFRSYLPRLVERGELPAAEADETLAEFTRCAAEPGARMLALVMVDVVLRKP